MPTRSLLVKGTATASLQGILHYPLDFLVPSALAPTRGLRRYTGSPSRLPEVVSPTAGQNEAGEDDNQLWTRADRTGKAVGEGSSTGSIGRNAIESEELEHGRRKAGNLEDMSPLRTGAVSCGIHNRTATSTPRRVATPADAIADPETHDTNPTAECENRRLYRSVSHQLLAQPDPLSASLIKDYLRLRPSLVTATSLNPLIHHAQRTNNRLVERHARRARETIDERYWRAQETYTPPPDPHLPHPAQTQASHPWARKAHPPHRYIQPLDVFQSLADLHYRLVCASPAQPPPTPDEAVAAIRRDCATEGRGRDGTVEALSWVLHFYVIYAERLFLDMDGSKVLREFSRLCPELRPTKQTLHLLVTRLLWPTLLDLNPAHGDPAARSDSSDPPEDTRISKRPLPSDDPETINRVFSILSHFATTHNISPGTETLRQIGIFANATDDPSLARIAFDGWYTAFEEGYTRTPGEGDTARYAHRGSSWSKWRGLVRSWGKRGWVEQLGAEGGEGGRRDKGNYRWVEGESGIGHAVPMADPKGGPIGIREGKVEEPRDLFSDSTRPREDDHDRGMVCEKAIGRA